MEWFSWGPWHHAGAQLGLSTSIQAALDLRIISHNIRYATLEPFPNEQLWSVRAPAVLSQLKHETRFVTVAPSAAVTPDTPASDHASALICLQEVLHTQLVDVMAGLNRISVSDGDDTPSQGPRWSYVGVGRDDGETAGEYSPIIYPTQHLSVLRNQTVWLSQTPSTPSKGWDAASIRILNICLFEHKATGQLILAANTHLDDQGAVSRQEGVKLILKELEQWHHRWSRDGQKRIATFLAGDFNSKLEEAAYQTMNSSKSMRDVYELVERRKRLGHEVTFTGFEPEKGSEDIGRIDFIWLYTVAHHEHAAIHEPREMRTLQVAPWKDVSYAVLPNVFDDGVYLSDHRPVVVDAKLAS